MAQVVGLADLMTEMIQAADHHHRGHPYRHQHRSDRRGGHPNHDQDRPDRHRSGRLARRDGNPAGPPGAPETSEYLTHLVRIGNRVKERRENLANGT